MTITRQYPLMPPMLVVTLQECELIDVGTATSSNGVDSPSATVIPPPTVVGAPSENPPSTPEDPMITPYTPSPSAPASATAPVPAPTITPTLAAAIAPPSSANGTHRSHDRLTLVSPDLDPETDSPPIPALPTMTPAESSRKARRQQREAAQAQAQAQAGPGFVQETDAGRVALLPPSYDPAWAQEGIPNLTEPSPETGGQGEVTRPEDLGEGGGRRSEDAERVAHDTDTTPDYAPPVLAPPIESDGTPEPGEAGAEHPAEPVTHRLTHPQLQDGHEDQRPQSTDMGLREETRSTSPTIPHPPT